MDEARLAAAERAYEAGDNATAAREYLAAAHGSAPEGTGHAYHQAGNALMRLSRYKDAITVYGHALKDAAYDKRGAVSANLGTALVATGCHADAVQAFDAAVADPSYAQSWKALQGKAGALFELKRYDEAATAYREAAWSEGNPDPGRALNNLGLCFMAVHNPAEAVEAYKAALGIEGYSSKGKASANLGLAYAAMGFNDEAMRAFESALHDHGYYLTGAAATTYEAVKAAAVAPVAAPEEPAGAVETVEGWSTGEMPPVYDQEAPASWGEADTGSTTTIGPLDEDNAFFTRTEEDMRQADKAARKAERAQRRAGRSPAGMIALVTIVVLVFVGVLVGAWYTGFGYPTQQATVAGMIDTYRSGGDVAEFWVAVPATDVKQEMRLLPARFKSYAIGAVEAGPMRSRVRVTVTLDEKATLAYDVLLVREGVGWKVNGIRNAWRSTPTGS